MDVTYKFRVDSTYYRTLIDRFYQQRPLLLRLSIQFGLLALILAAVFFWLVVAPLGVKVGVALLIGALVFFGGVALAKWGAYQRLKRRSDFGSEATVTLSTVGISSSGSHAEGKWNWAAFPHAVRYSDGIMLLRRGVVRWLPDSALVVGTPAEAIAVVRSKSALRKLA